jgi:hypothetical protein
VKFQIVFFCVDVSVWVRHIISEVEKVNMAVTCDFARPLSRTKILSPWHAKTFSSLREKLET